MKRSLALSLFAALPLFSVAQKVTPAAPPKPEEDNVITLSMFTVMVEKDSGYIAADTISASRLSTNLLKTPGNFDVLTRDLINDLGVFNIDEASSWLTNSRPLELGAIEGNSMNPGSLAQNDSATNVTLRGLTGQASTRNYFTSGSTPKEYNVDRVEASRGPNAILYGEGGPGGQVNYMTKRARSRNFTTLRFRTDSLWSKGASLDINRKLTDKVDMRVNLSGMDQRYHIARSRFKTDGGALNVVYRPYERTTVTVDFDMSRTSRPGLIMTYGEQYAKWDRKPVTGKLTTAQATAAGLVNWTGDHRWTWVDGLGMLDLTGYPRTSGYGLPIPTEVEYGDAVFPGIGGSLVKAPDRGFNANPKQTDVVDRTRDVQLSIDHVFKNKLSLQLAGQYSKYYADKGMYTFTTVYVDPMSVLPNGQTNPNFGKPLSNSYVGRTIDAERDSKSVRFVAAYPVKFYGTTTFSAFLQHQEQSSDTVYTDLHIIDPTSTRPITDGSSLINVYRYWDNLSDSMPDFRKMYNTVDVPTSQGKTKQKIQAFMVAMSGSYLDDTLTVIGGFRRDKSGLDTANGDSGTRNPVTGAFTTYTRDSRLAFNNTTTVGLVYFPIKMAGVYANHAEGFTIQTISNPRFDGTFTKANIVPATDESYGLRFQFGDGKGIKIVGSVGHYMAKQENSAFTIGVGSINTLWNNHGMPGNFIKTFSPDPISTAAANGVTSSRSFIGSGWEASVTANIGNSFRLVLNGALPRTKQADVGADYAKYTSTHMAQWQAWADLPAAQNPTKAADTTAVNQIKQALTGFQDGRAQNLTYKYRYNALGVYTFSKAALKGLRLGLGAQFFGPSLIGNPTNDAFAYIYAKSYYTMNANLGYPFKIGRTKMDVQLNIDNLLNYDKPLFNGLFPQTLPNGSTAMIPYGFKYQWPRAARLTLTIPF
ncbi:MAG: hypothetical protein HZA31_05290 [Opitutae bacterium]|nr:hypothetical protein [Opitutae bacterium]